MKRYFLIVLAIFMVAGGSGCVPEQNTVIAGNPSDAFESPDEAAEVSEETEEPSTDAPSMTGASDAEVAPVTEETATETMPIAENPETSAVPIIGEPEAGATPVTETPQADNPIGVTLSIKDVTPTGGTLVFTQKGGAVTGELLTGQWYEFQIQNPDGKWIDASTRDEIAWEDVAYFVALDGTTELPINWEFKYGRRDEGHFRIAKRIMDLREAGDYDTYEVYAEFSIGNEAASD